MESEKDGFDKSLLSEEKPDPEAEPEEELPYTNPNFEKIKTEDERMNNLNKYNTNLIEDIYRGYDPEEADRII